MGEATALFLTSNGLEAHREIANLAQARGLQPEVKQEAFLVSQVGKVPHQGILARVRPYAYASVETALGERGPILALCGVENPGNLGAVIRTAAAFGVRGLLLEDSGSVRVNATVRRAAAGYLHCVRIARCEISETIALAEPRTWIALDPRADESVDDCFRRLEQRPVGLVFGAEGKGIPLEVLRRVDATARIPISREVESLNLAVAVGICVFALGRRED